jgi:hypothetical protein
MGVRQPGKYVVEPDGSLNPNNDDDLGLEFVSPPLPIDEMLSDLEKVKAWAKQRGCYTNSSTGLHINISVPNFDPAKLDYVKLALLLGDKYVLDQFGRSSNTYTKLNLWCVKIHKWLRRCWTKCAGTWKILPPRLCTQAKQKNSHQSIPNKIALSFAHQVAIG